MHVLNFGHPLSADVLTQIGELNIDAGFDPEHVLNVKVQVDQALPMVPQVEALVDSIGWTPEEWQTRQFAVVLPGLAAVAAILCAELHGRSGYFPTIIRLKPVPGAVPPRFDLGEVISLAEVREVARSKR